jgi:hypothetical protein
MIEMALAFHGRAVHFAERLSNFESNCLGCTLMNQVYPPEVKK